MTTGSSSSRTTEYAISAEDLPAGETTSATGTHTVRPSTARSPARRGPVPREPTLRQRMFRAGGPSRPAPREPVPEPDVADLLSDEDLFPDEDPHGVPAREPADRDDASRSYGDPVGDLVRAAVADRPLEEVVDLITMLEQSPLYAGATGDALRAVGVARSVEDVTRLADLLTRPPRRADSADEAIRAAVAHHPVEDVTRLMTLLHRTPLEPRCGQEAVRAAATGRPVEDLVELIGRLAEEQRSHAGRPEPGPARPVPEDGYATEEPWPAEEPAATAVAGSRRRERRRALLPVRWARARGRAPRDRDRRPVVRRAVGRALWPTWCTVTALAGCGVAHFPLHRNDASVGGYAVALGMSALCLAVALVLTVRAAVPVLAVAVVLPAALAAAGLYGTAAPSAEVSRTVDLTLAPAWVAVGAAVLASLVALTALCVRVASQAPARGRTVRTVTRARRAD
ncbi:hypothetical protein [Streptomyces sp. NPDC127100]|uniref:hypothetical protein n=1 Tax=Streptomyces sp. NPDC127100 TaxID=3347138 RepID=UPI003669D686